MPYILSPVITTKMTEMWMEGTPYEKKELYSIQSGRLPPVNYDAHILKSHSMTHAEAELHVIDAGRSLDFYFNDPKFYYGRVVVIRLPGNSYKPVGKDIFHWEVTKEELQTHVQRVSSASSGKISKLLLTTEFYPVNADGFHDPNYVLTLHEEAAQWLVSQPEFNLYGTSWKSSDFKPGSAERPIHKILLRQASIFELLDLKSVPEGEYFFVGFPLRIQGASESPVCPVLFTRDEILG
jgi:kynurenine formamidase